ncbi:MAG: 50S ribosomal protein L11 methyltransferase, partial [Sphingomicrobium sp.]
MSWRVTLRCTRAEAEALPGGDDLFALSDQPPVIVADEPDPHSPDDLRIHAYFAEQPTTQELVLLRRLAANGEPDVEHLEDTSD